jgi:hypothetical protein
MTCGGEGKKHFGYAGRVGEIERKVKEYIDTYSLFDFQ